ncbi:hydrogenase maturation protein [Wenzhouxiangella limi]|uniref:Hydrogenase maturation protein n=1 Tax=Wenzhouxiangella limi TaxID=2707351 RepID=A0A845UYA3_9GAMM|nr:hydrogenase maturation protein [Wenzhouxiangella limi]NDY95688.1 hydrogenase maturation protein [Wenzhouxiangella limi]
MRILLTCHAFNSLSQRVHAELRAAGHAVSVELDISDEVTAEAVELFKPDVLVAPFLKRKIPESVFAAVPCLIVHPGPPGDRGPAALDWAVLENEPEWGVSIIQATEELDGGPVLASRMFATRPARKSSLYRIEVTEGAVAALFDALAKVERGEPGDPPPPGRWRDPVPPTARRIDWTTDDTATVLTKIRSADGFPGVIDEIAGREVRLFNAWTEPELNGEPGALLARCHGAICRATVDGAVWIGHLKESGDQPFKRRATRVLGEAVADLPELDLETDPESGRGPIRYREVGDVSLLDFDFYNGAMSTKDCRALLAAYQQATQRPTRVIVLAGGADFWSNGMDLNTIEAAASPPDESWDNIRAIDEVAEAIIRTTSHLTVSAIGGNAAAGGVFLALAADEVWARAGVVLNPHYKNMGNLYGSEYWTYLLPKRVGEGGIKAVMGHRLPMLAAEAQDLGLVDRTGPTKRSDFDAFALEQAARLAADGFENRLAAKAERREHDEAERALHEYRDAELERMRMNFYGFDPSYHVARFRLVRRSPHAWTPLYLAHHRARVGTRNPAGPTQG